MLEKMVGCARTLTETDIVQLEHQIGVHLPDEYRAFLLRFNGGKPSPYCFPIRGMPKNPYGVIREFYGIECPVLSSNLKWNCEVFWGDSPRDLLPIADTPGGNQLCLCLFGTDAGSIFLWDYYGAPRNPLSREGTFFVARSFQELIDGLFRLPEVQT
jgi:hypothetical protein